MDLRAVNVSKCLDKRLILFGFEVYDLLAIFLTLSVLNLLFGQMNTGMKLLFVWLPTLIIALVLHYGKKGKPEMYLVHWVRYQIKPGTLSAFDEPSVVVPPPRIGRSL
jgi:hypothetical protein